MSTEETHAKGEAVCFVQWRGADEYASSWTECYVPSAKNIEVETNLKKNLSNDEVETRGMLEG